jgi:hypothetical protein
MADVHIVDQIQTRLLTGGTGSTGAVVGGSSKAKRMVFPSLQWVDSWRKGVLALWPNGQSLLYPIRNCVKKRKSQLSCPQLWLCKKAELQTRVTSSGERECCVGKAPGGSEARNKHQIWQFCQQLWHGGAQIGSS